MNPDGDASVTLLRADVEAILAGPGDGSWVCADARARVRSVLADLDRRVPATAEAGESRG